MPTHEITLRAMRFHVLVGILPHERELPQPIEIDVTARVSAGDGIVDYRQIYEATSAILSAGPIDFLEEIAERVAGRLFADHERVTSLRVAVRKPQVALGGPLAYAEVAIDRTRND